MADITFTEKLAFIFTIKKKYPIAIYFYNLDLMQGGLPSPLHPPAAYVKLIVAGGTAVTPAPPC